MAESAPCEECVAALAGWMRGGPHLMCRECETREAGQTIEGRAAFYARLAVMARTGPEASGPAAAGRPLIEQ